ncbi:uncharacterized protein LOC112520616 isoform X2 [Cynara cardunculus var. scolymus]|uniref:uncharacterized protein LOC112520616 isoform X2 n=1 Tax=Cynara cardunculus var. scolymus TaxID=59895 RepID=UPI000D62B9B7|nr:uncharacterized protein LOC112520616 isoform X2 [Cynara cardunculus var. scolymus]
MNSSSSNSNNGFSNFNETNPVLGFNSQPLAASRKSGVGAATSSGSNLSRPRLLKVRKQTSTHNHKPTNPLDNRVAGVDRGLGFNQFGSSSQSVLGNLSSGSVAKEALLFGANRGNNSSSYSGVNVNAILDDMSRLKIDATGNNAFGSENNKSVDTPSMVDELPKEINNKEKNSQGEDPIKKSQFMNSVGTNVALELENEMKRMNLKDPKDIYSGSDNFRSSVFVQNTKTGNQCNEEEAYANLLSDRMCELKVSGDGETSRSSSRRSEKMAEFAFTSKLDDIGAPHVEFKTPDMKSNMFSGLNRFEAKKESVKDTKSKKKKGKPKKPIVGQSRFREDFGFSGRSWSENVDISEAYSPMDISPYHETQDDKCYRETSLTSEEGSQIDDQNSVSSESHIMISNVTTDEDLLGSIQCLDISDGDLKPSLARDEVFESHINEVSATESFKSATENLEFSSDTFVTALDSDESSTATSGRQESAAMRVFNFASKSDHTSKDSFTFAASPSSPRQFPSDTRQHKKKHPLKVIHDSYSSTSDAKNSYVPSSSAEFFPISGNSSIFSPGKGQKVDSSISSSEKKDNLKPVNEQDFQHKIVTTSSSSKRALEACEKWRLRGNQAYSNGDLAKAEDCYTQGLNSVSQSEQSRSCLRALMLCYSNRSATRISLGRMREALGDCLMAATIDPNFLKVQVRAAHCYLAIGEPENAKQQYMKCLQSGTDNSVDGKVIAEASEGLEKTQKVLDCIKHYSDLPQRQASEEIKSALSVIDEALQISPCSEKLLQIKAEALFMLRRYKQAIQVCEQTLSSVEVDTPTSFSSTLWRSRLIVTSYFYLGMLDEALEFIKKQENSGHITQRVEDRNQESAIPLADTIRELLSRKAAGNEAYKSGKHTEAVEHYTAALSSKVESRPFAAICFCNRAAAYRALGQITDAIADCSLAIALDPNYLKVEEKGGATDKISHMNELKQTQARLADVEEESRKGIPLNMYLILGIESTASAADIKKAYRKAALRHHPDKAAQSLGRNDDGDDGLWKEIAENVHKDADRLFKMIGEAYAVLSNPSKRSRYDQDEEMRNEPHRFTRSNTSRMAAEGQNSAFEQSTNRREWQDSWRPNVNTQSTGSEKPDSSYRYSRY